MTQIRRIEPYVFRHTNWRAPGRLLIVVHGAGCLRSVVLASKPVAWCAGVAVHNYRLVYVPVWLHNILVIQASLDP